MADIPVTLLDRLWRSFRDLVRAEIPSFTYYGRWEYTVQAVASDGSTVDCSIDTSNVPLPNLVAVPLAPGVACERVKLQVGSRCTVAFVNGDPSRPQVVGGDFAGVPTSIKFAGGGPASVRVGDVLNAGYIVIVTTPAGTWVSATYFAGTAAGLVLANAAVAAAVAGGNVGTLVAMTDGRTTSGSNIVQVGG